MVHNIYDDQLANLCLLSKDLLNFEPPYRKCWLRPCIVLPIIPELFLILFTTHYSQNYSGIRDVYLAIWLTS